MAVLPAGSAASEEGRVRLADVRLAWQADGTWHGAAAFDVEPGKLTQCPLWLPKGCRLVQTTLAGTPVDPLPASGGGWLLPLTSEPAVQRGEGKRRENGRENGSERFTKIVLTRFAFPTRPAHNRSTCEWWVPTPIRRQSRSELT
jgi:hypothetical protein